MVSRWGRDSHFNNEQIKTRDVVIINAEYGSSGSLGSIVGSKSIGHRKNTGRRRCSCSESTPIHGPVHKSDMNFHNQ